MSVRLRARADRFVHHDLSRQDRLSYCVQCWLRLRRPYVKNKARLTGQTNCPRAAIFRPLAERPHGAEALAVAEADVPRSPERRSFFYPGFLRTQTKTPRGGRGKKAKMLTLHYPLSYR